MSEYALTVVRGFLADPYNAFGVGVICGLTLALLLMLLMPEQTPPPNTIPV
jgi:hypothetical protein